MLPPVNPGARPAGNVPVAAAGDRCWLRRGRAEGHRPDEGVMLVHTDAAA